MIAFFYFYYLAELPPVDKIKAHLLRISKLGDKIGVPIADTDKDWADELIGLSYAMFCYHKQSKKTFTVCNNRKLKDIRIQEDADGFSESDSLVVMNFIRENLLSVFAELISYSYLPRSRQGQMSQLFVAEVNSRYSGDKHAVFFANQNDEVYIFDNALTEIRLLDYISNYFSASGCPDAEIEEVCNIVISDSEFIQKQGSISSKIEEFNRNVVNKHGFIFGAITFLDFLAWKGLWQSQNDSPLKEVSDLIEDFKNRLDELSREYFREAKDIPVSSLISISDTIAVFTPKTSNADIHALLRIHARFSQYVLEKCCTKQYAIRGAIAYGEYSTMKSIMIGPGIDECASWHETGNWIGVHLTPTAQLYWESFGEANDIVCTYEVPLKAGLKADYCVRWSISQEEFKRLAIKNRALLPEISGKYTNTQKFLRKIVWNPEGGVDDGKK